MIIKHLAAIFFGKKSLLQAHSRDKTLKKSKNYNLAEVQAFMMCNIKMQKMVRKIRWGHDQDPYIFKSGSEGKLVYNT